MTAYAPMTESLAGFIASATYGRLTERVRHYSKRIIFDGVGVLAAATHPDVTAAAGMASFVEAHGGDGPATLIGRARRCDIVSAVFANGTLGYAADFEPHHPEAILHPVAVMIPTALAIAEARGRTGADFVAAVVLGCEVTYRVSMALDPRGLYDLGFHPSAIAGTFGAAAAAANLMGLSARQCQQTLGLSALQTSGILAWQDDPREDARPFQMGMAARNGVTAALLAEQGFGAPDRVFDGGHTVFRAYSRAARPEMLTAGLGEVWDGVMELAIKPYPCVSFLHPALDALETLLAREKLSSLDIAAIDLRFANAGAHCVDDNPLKGHNAQYILPVRTAMGRLSYLDLFTDRRLHEPEVARLAAATTVTRDFDAFDASFPDFYIGEITLTLTDGRRLVERREIARGYPEVPLGDDEIRKKFAEVTAEVATETRRADLAEAAWAIDKAVDVTRLAACLAAKPTQ